LKTDVFFLSIFQIVLIWYTGFQNYSRWQCQTH